MHSCLEPVSCVHYHHLMQCIIKQSRKTLYLFSRADKGKYSVVLWTKTLHIAQAYWMQIETFIITIFL